MNIINTKIQGLKILEPKIIEDTRGRFTKVFNNDFFKTNNLSLTIAESYFSISHKDVIRGMHFQTPPYDHIKLVYVPKGEIVDVVLDIRKKSPTYGDFFRINLSDENGKILIIPKGLAHGFKSLQNNTNVTYMQTSCYAPSNDGGIHFDSFGFDWEINNPRLSERDVSFSSFTTFNSPFLFI
ncbi:MAG: dTDP-4-dehydrorhamnose 3,5-epimerase family protein [Sulfurimonas sp.]|jgi:dTDP-4-dehydrorhamnose 3,5-epimerase/CDP-3, 6-dideoxy-D-glycero-D-glycero-4-hexulose-5-epimerase